MMGKRSRSKGGRGEREAAEALRPVFPEAFRRIGQTRAKKRGADVEGCGPYFVEVEMSARPSPHRKMRQALREVPHGFRGAGMAGLQVRQQPIAVLTRECSRARSGPWHVTMLLDDWLDVVRRAQGSTGLDDLSAAGAPSPDLVPAGDPHEGDP